MTFPSISPGYLYPYAPTLPTEVWERIIDIVAADYTDLFRRRGNLSSLALVCRSWTPRARHHLLHFVNLHSSSNLSGFLLTLSKHRGSGDSVQNLDLDSAPKRQGLQTSVDEDPLEAYPCEWIHKAISTLPPLLPSLRTLALWNMPTLHPVTSILWSRFVNVEELTLVEFKHHSFSELTRLINGFPKLRTLTICECTWSRPIRFCYRVGRPRPTQLNYGGLTDAVCARDFAKWASSSQLISTLRHLEWTVKGTASEINDVMRGCSHSLEEFSLMVEQPDESPWGKWPCARVFIV